MPEAYRRVIYRIRFERAGVCFLVLYGEQQQIYAFRDRIEKLVPMKGDKVTVYIDKGEYTNMDPGQFPTEWELLDTTRPNAKNIGKA